MNVIPAIICLIFLVGIFIRINFWMPGFFKMIPKDEPGEWIAVVLKNNVFRGREEIYTKKVKGFRKAYFVARFAALRADWTVDSAGGYIGIDYAIRAPKENE